MTRLSRGLKICSGGVRIFQTSAFPPLMSRGVPLEANHGGSNSHRSDNLRAAYKATIKGRGRRPRNFPSATKAVFWSTGCIYSSAMVRLRLPHLLLDPCFMFGSRPILPGEFWALTSARTALPSTILLLEALVRPSSLFGLIASIVLGYDRLQHSWNLERQQLR